MVSRNMSASAAWRTPVALVACCAAAVLAAPATGLAQTPAPDAALVSLEDLMQTEITSVSRRPQPLSAAAASVYVLTSEDIRRSGASTIPDLLRLVPGLHVGQLDSNKWSVAVRGSGGRFANKLLVLVDGRSAYTPLYSGVWWHLVNVPLDEIERIEVVRGPGATIWGANAVNGVINIISRSSAASKGGRMTVAAGTEDRGFGSLRYSGSLGANATYRVDTGGLFRDGSPGTFPSDELDTWRNGRAGGRVDWQPREGDELTIEGSLIGSLSREVWMTIMLAPPYRRLSDRVADYSLGFAMGRWTRKTTRGATTVQALDEHTSMSEAVFSERRHTVDVDLQNVRRMGAHELVWGGTYRWSADRTEGSFALRVTPDHRVLPLWSGFGQDELSLHDGAIRVTAGTKVEHNGYTGWEVQPNLRVLVAPSGRYSLWGGVSRAVRLPSRMESDGLILAQLVPPTAQLPLLQVVTLRHDANPTASEVLLAYEGGYRTQPWSTLSLDVSVFRNNYHDLITNHFGAPAIVAGPSPYLDVPVLFGNGGRRSTAGGEIVADWRPAGSLRLNAGYSRLAILKSGRSAADVLAPTGDYPDHQLHLLGAVTLPRQVELNAAARHVSALASSGVPSYFTADVRVGFRVGRVDLAVVGRNLLAASHVEFLPDVLATANTSVERAVGLRLGWRF